MQAPVVPLADVRDLTAVDAPEEVKMKAVMYQSTKEFHYIA
jgi:hypothetical protein